MLPAKDETAVTRMPLAAAPMSEPVLVMPPAKVEECKTKMPALPLEIVPALLIPPVNDETLSTRMPALAAVIVPVMALTGDHRIIGATAPDVDAFATDADRTDVGDRAGNGAVVLDPDAGAVSRLDLAGIDEIAAE